MDGSWSGPGKVRFGGSSWEGPSSGAKKSSDTGKMKKQERSSSMKKKDKVAPSSVLHSNQTDKYKSLVVDSGAIIKHSAFSTLHNAATEYFTVPAVMDEIRDKKARSHLDSLPFKLQIRQPTSDGIAKVTEFSRLTGDYQSLSRVDMQILGLLYDLESEGCNGDMSHIRTKPKRTVGIGRMTSLEKESSPKGDEEKTTEPETSKKETEGSVKNEQGDSLTKPTFFEVSPDDIDISDDDADDEEEPNEEETEQNVLPVETKTEPVNEAVSKNDTAVPTVKKTWASAVNPSAASKSTNSLPSTTGKGMDEDFADKAVHFSFGSMNISGKKNDTESDLGGQFSDAEDDDDVLIPPLNSTNPLIGADNDDSDFEYDSDMEISDEECDVIVLDPDEVEERKQKLASSKDTVEEDLQNEFPSLAAAATVPESSDEIEADNKMNEKEFTMEERLAMEAKAEEERKAASLKPLSKNGQLYNSFRRYKHVVSSEGVAASRKNESIQDAAEREDEETPSNEPVAEADAAAGRNNNTHSRIMGGISMSGQGTEVEDDGEGWVGSVQEIASMKAMGTLDPSRAPNAVPDKKAKETGPPITSRSACATTDFAMQNVILQMNLQLLTVDGMKVRKLKSWVTRCGACFAVYSSGENNTDLGSNSKMIFCRRCGSDYLQRIAASVDGKTGRLRLHLKKNYTQNTRGTKFALPKPGQGNRFHGDLLLREDQLLYGAWNQTRKKVSGNKEAQSIFGADVASYVGCHKSMSAGDELRVGFGRKNPNATKFGRERRGKKKKSADKACGLRRYAN